MKLLILALFSLLPVAAQITASPSSVTVYMRKWASWPAYASRQPAPVSIDVINWAKGPLSHLVGNKWY